jgi:hypothetical protein
LISMSRCIESYPGHWSASKHGSSLHIFCQLSEVSTYS